MMKRLLFLLLTFTALAVEAAAPTISVTPSRTSCTAPCVVFFDATGTTGVDYNSGLFTHEFGMPSVGTWSNGALEGASKNGATGITVSAVYETAGTYTTRHRVCNSSNECDSTTKTITVANPDTTFSGTNTICYANGSDFTGCPSGATQTGSTNTFSLASCTAGKRCLFRRGDTFTVSSQQTINTTLGMVGAYGTGAKPIISSTVASNAVIKFGSTGNPATDWRIMDLDIRYVSGASAVAIGMFSAISTQITILRVDMAGFGTGVDCYPGEPIAYINDQIAVVESATTSVTGFNSVFCGATRMTLLGNSLDNNLGGQHTVRLPYVGKGYIAHNTIARSNSGVHLLKLHAPDYDIDALYTEYVNVFGNKFTAGGSVGIMLSVGPQNNLVNERVRNSVFSSNWIVGGSSTSTGIILYSTNITVRNNIFDLSASAIGTGSGCNAVDSVRRGIETAPDTIRVYNNTMYWGSANCITRGVRFQATVSNSVATNNLGYAPSGTTPDMILDSGTANSASTNSSDAQLAGTNPAFEGALTSPKGFRPTTASYAASGGTTTFPASNDDFFRCDDVTANERIGALVPRARATCRGAK